MTPDLDPGFRPEGEHTPSAENDAYRAMSFYEIHTRILDQKTPAEERQKLTQERSNRYAAANENGLFDDFRARVNQAIRTNEGVAAETAVRAIATEIERTAMEMEPGYTPENHRMLHLAGRDVANRLRVQRYQRDNTQVAADGVETEEQARRIAREARLGTFVDGILIDRVGTEVQPVAAQAADAGLAALAAAQRRQADVQERMYELSMLSYDDFIDQEDQRAPINPLNLLAQRPGWYRTISENPAENKRLQQQVEFRSRLSYAARAKQELGPLNLEVSIHPENMEWKTNVWDDMWMDMPGFRIALVTQMKENFRVDPKDPGFVVMSEQGQKNYQDQAKYFQEQIDRLTQYLIAHPEEMEKNRFPMTVVDNTKKAHLLATAAVNVAKNMIFVGGLVESSDVGRKVKAKEVSSEQLKAFMHPLAKALEKSKAGDEKSERQRYTAEEWGGGWGDWYLQGVSYVKGFTEMYTKGDVSGPEYFPSRMFCSLFENSTYEKDEESSHSEESFAHAILTAKEDRDDDFGLIDVGDPTEYRPNRLGENYDLWGPLHADLMDSVYKVFAVLTVKLGEEPKAPSLIEVANALAKLRKHPSLAKTYTGEDLVMACVVAKGGGPLMGSYFDRGRTVLLGVEPKDYDGAVNDVTMKSRLFEGSDRLRERILNRLLAEDLTKASFISILKEFGGTLGRLGTKRGRLTEAAQRNANIMRRQEYIDLK